MQNTYLVAVKGCCSYTPVSGPKIIHCYISKEMSACILRFMCSAYSGLESYELDKQPLFLLRSGRTGTVAPDF
jgi:hypothetical protein